MISLASVISMLQLDADSMQQPHELNVQKTSWSADLVDFVLRSSPVLHMTLHVYAKQQWRVEQYAGMVRQRAFRWGVFMVMPRHSPQGPCSHASLDRLSVGLDHQVAQGGGSHL